ncbi:MAG: death-on-curing protein [Bacteroidia bacterium]|nr:MAG: death-on-curing protein [Bacteroidia bacterium]
MESKGEILIYQTDDNKTEIEVRLEDETVWLTQQQIAQLFGVQRPAITKHLRNIFKDGELNESMVCSILEHTTQHGAISGKNQVKQVKYYNLDAIIAVGYRVNSKRATQFRIWATQRLKEYLIKGYSINFHRLQQEQFFLQTLEDLKKLIQNNTLIEAKDILTLIQSFSNTFFALERYDKNVFPSLGTKKEVLITAEELFKDIGLLKKQLINKGEATELFALEKTKDALKGIFANVFQTVFGEDAYPTIEEKAAHLLYFIVKNHPFVDGNKRCGAFAFVWFLQKANYPYENKINPEALTSLTLLIAESNPNDKEKMIGVIKLLLGTEN